MVLMSEFDELVGMLKDNDQMIRRVFVERHDLLSRIYEIKSDWNYDEYIKTASFISRNDPLNSFHQIYNVACNMVLITVLQKQLEREFSELKELANKTSPKR